MRSAFRSVAIVLALIAGPFLLRATEQSDATKPISSDQLLLVVGAAGEQSYAEGFKNAADTWEKLAARANIAVSRVDTTGGELAARERIRTWISERDPSAPGTLWIVYIGHGTHSGAGTKLNLRGPDVSSEELKTWLEPLDRRLVFIHGGSASAPFIPALSRPGRIIITATKSAEEQNYARFGEAFARALENERSDLDLDGQISLLEAFISASNAVQTSYIESGRLSTEHALIDDDGDGKGVTAQSFQGLRPIHVSGDSSFDGQSARRIALVPASGGPILSEDQLLERDRFEEELEAMRRKKDSMNEADYYRELERIFRALSALYVEPDQDS